MAFDLAVFGGTGQWVLMELLLRHLRGEDVELPENVWIIDPHQPDVARSLPAQLRSIEERAGRASVRIRPTRDARLTTTLDSVLDDELTPPTRYEQLRQLLSSASTVYERTYSTERGFFALPRLAASWVALAGFETPPPFLEDLYLEVAGNPLIITGSLAGGTGAGLIPQILLRTRTAPSDRWKRTIVVQAILPWFNPELGNAAGTGDTVKWAQCRRNAADGVRALNRIMNDIAVRAPGGQLDLPETLCSVAGIPAEVAERTAPPEHQQVAASGVTPAFIRAVADSLLHLAEEREAEAAAAVEKVVFGPATLAVPRGSANDPLARYQQRDGFVAQQLLALSNAVMTKKDHVVSRATVSLHRGFGRALGQLFVARALTGFSARTQHQSTAWKLFWDSWIERITTRAASLDDGAGSGMAIASDMDRTIAIVDKAYGDDQRLAAMLRQADVPAETSAAAGRQIADQFVDILLRAESAALAAAAGEYAYLVPRGALAPTREAAAARLQAFEAAEVRQLANSYYESTFMEFHGSSYARTFGTAHKLADMLRSTNQQDVSRAFSSKVITPLITLWRAALHGLLTYDARPLDERDPIIDRLIRHEQIERDFGSTIVTVSYRGSMLGFLTAELGFVPHVEVIDELGELDSVRQAFRRCAAALSSAADADLAILRAFAQYATEQYNVQPDVAWAKLLLAGAAAGANARALLEAQTIPSRPISLRTSETGASAELPLPLLVDETTLASLRIIAGTTRAADLFKVDSGVLQFDVLGAQAELGNYSLVSGHRYLTSVVPKEIQEAARFVEEHGTGNSLVVSHWR